MHIIGRRHCVQ